MKAFPPLAFVALAMFVAEGPAPAPQKPYEPSQKVSTHPPAL